MVSDAYEKNFRGMASAIDNTNRRLGLNQKVVADILRQHADLVLRVIELEKALQKIRGGG